MKRSFAVAAVAALFMALAAPALAKGPPPDSGPGEERVRPMILVTSQGVVYDSIVGPNLPMKGRFQKLIVDPGDMSLSTEFGPGDPGYLGGRWWIDVNGDNVMDAGDKYFSCPLIGVHTP